MSLTQLIPDPVVFEPGAPAATLGILYEHPAWFERLFNELNRRGVPYEKLLAPDHFYDPGGSCGPGGRADRFHLVFNRMSPSADRREHGSGILYTQSWLGHLELQGVRVVNGSKAFRYDGAIVSLPNDPVNLGSLKILKVDGNQKKRWSTPSCV